jgi:hypothetical protein
VQIREGTHQVMMEKNRTQLFATLQPLLEENLKTGRPRRRGKPIE